MKSSSHLPLRGFGDFLDRLHEVRWSPPELVPAGVVSLLAGLRDRPWILRDEVMAWASGDLELRGMKSRDTSTHYKWFIDRAESSGCRVWLHQYKPRATRGRGYAVVPHNHRYSFASIILRGGFTHHRFQRQGEHLGEVLRQREVFRADKIYTLTYDEIHSLSDISDLTMTLVVESPVIRNYSEAFYDEAGKPKKFSDMVALYPSVMQTVDAL